MTAVDITNKQDLIKYLNEREFEATIEIADIELEAVCTIKDIDFFYDVVTGVEVSLVSLCGAPASYFVSGIVRLAEERLSRHEDVLVDVRSTVQYVLDMQDGCRGDWTGGDRFDSIEERERDREVCNG